MLLYNKVRVAKDHGKMFPSELAASFSEVVYHFPNFYRPKFFMVNVVVWSMMTDMTK